MNSSNLKYSDENSKAKPNQLLKINHLSKNVLMLILNYLPCNENYALVLSNKTLYNKLFNDSVFKKVSYEAYLTFFYVQFKKRDDEIQIQMLQAIYGSDPADN